MFSVRRLPFNRSETLERVYVLGRERWRKRRTGRKNFQRERSKYVWVTDVWRPLSCVQLFATPRTIQVHWNLPARILQWVAFPFSRGSSQYRDRTQVSCIAGRFFTSWATREAQEREWVAYPFSRGSPRPRNPTGFSCIAGGFFSNWAIREAGRVQN